MKTGTRPFLILVIGLFQLSCAQENRAKNGAQDFPFTEDHWRIVDKEGMAHSIDTMMYDNKMALHLPLGHRAHLKNQKFKNFEIEFDVIGFVMPGLGFREQDKDNYELIYFRINSSNKKDALQYIPIYNGSLPWQLYNYPKYEASAAFAEKKVISVPLSYQEYLKQGPISDSLRLELEKKGVVFSKKAQVQFVNEETWGIGDIEQLKGVFLKKTTTNWDLWNPYVWTHIKIIVIEDKAAVYVEDMTVPKLVIKHLKQNVQSGGICLRNQFFDVFFTNISIKGLNDDASFITDADREMFPDNYLKDWELSPKFVKKEEEILSQLDSIQESDDLWKKINSDNDGLVNISRFVEDMSGTVVLKSTIHSKSEQSVKMSFDFARHMMVVLNNKVVFNKNMDASKEEGRVFVEDESVELNLSKGKNNLFLILTGDEEYKQNWGFIARLEDLNGITIE